MKGPPYTKRQPLFALFLAEGGFRTLLLPSVINAGCMCSKFLLLQKDPLLPKENVNNGSLLRLFKSEFFDSWFIISYMYRYREHVGVQDYLANELYKLSDVDVEFYLVQLCYLLIRLDFVGTYSLERFLLDKAAKSIHFALQLAWIFSSMVEDPMVTDLIVKDYCKRMRQDVEIACVNVKRPLPSTVKKLLQQEPVRNSSEDVIGDLTSSLDSYLTCFEKNEYISKSMETIDFAMGKSARFEYFTRLISFVDKLQGLSDKMRFIPIENRQATFQERLQVLNHFLLYNGTGLYLPITQSNKPHFCIVNIVSEDAKVLKSRDRAPILISLEVLISAGSCSYPDLHKLAASHIDDIRTVIDILEEKQNERKSNLNDLNDSNDSNDSSPPPTESSPSSAFSRSVYPNPPTLPKISSTPPYNFSSHLSPFPSPSTKLSLKTHQRSPSANVGKRSKTISHPSSCISSSSDEAITFPVDELWVTKKERIRKKSPFGHLPNWDLFSVIVKYGDDLRQEQMALQLVTQFHEIFRDAEIPIYLRPYSILITSYQSGLVETVLDSVSLHQIKRTVPGFTTLDNYYKRMYNYPSNEYKVAQLNFVESMAGYSILTYLLQIKDRHNGNLLIDAEGHVVHIDFGFMLSNSPGFNMNFESAPFKMTQEFIAVMDGVDSNVFQVVIFQFFSRSPRSNFFHFFSISLHLLYVGLLRPVSIARKSFCWSK